jgi:hypothetical protein
MHLGTAGAIADFESAFASVPHTLYLDNTKRQNSPTGCSVFAIDDIHNLYVTEQYLPKEYKNSGLFGYLEKNSKQKVENNGNSIQLTALPIAFMRTAQTSRLENDILGTRNEEEQKQPINKKGETAWSSAKKSYRKAPITNRVQNLRVEDKLETIARHNHTFMITNPKQEIDKKMNQFTVASLQERLAAKINQQQKPPRS